MSNQWTYWEEALRGNFIEDLIQPGNPQSGYYRDRNRAVCIWRRERDGKLTCLVTSGFHPEHEDQIDELFGWVCRKPITRELFMHIRDGGAWPEDVAMPTIGDNSAGRPMSEIIASQIEEKKREMEAWLEKIGGEIVTEAHALKADNFSDIFQKLGARADEARKAEKRPLDEQVSEIQRRWNPVLDAADACKRFIKAKWGVWGAKERERKRKEEEDRRAELARQQREAEEMARERGEEPPPPPADLTAPPSKVKVSTAGRGRVSMRTRKVVAVSDPNAMLAYFSTLEPPPPELVDVAMKLAKKLLEGGTTVPGAELKEESYAA